MCARSPCRSDTVEMTLNLSGQRAKGVGLRDNSKQEMKLHGTDRRRKGGNFRLTNNIYCSDIGWTELWMGTFEVILSPVGMKIHIHILFGLTKTAISVPITVAVITTFLTSLSSRCCLRLEQPTVVCHVSVVTVDFQATFKDVLVRSVILKALTVTSVLLPVPPYLPNTSFFVFFFSFSFFLFLVCYVSL